MIKCEIITLNNIEYDKTYSDIGMKIERDDRLYDEAIDPKNSGRIYNETDIPITNELA